MAIEGDQRESVVDVLEALDCRIVAERAVVQNYLDAAQMIREYPDRRALCFHDGWTFVFPMHCDVEDYPACESLSEDLGTRIISLLSCETRKRLSFCLIEEGVTRRAFGYREGAPDDDFGEPLPEEFGFDRTVPGVLDLRCMARKLGVSQGAWEEAAEFVIFEVRDSASLLPPPPPSAKVRALAEEATATESDGRKRFWFFGR